MNSTTVTHFTTTAPPTTTDEFGNCPFVARNELESKSIYCPQDYCIAVYLVSTGPASRQYPNLMGCYEYEGSLFIDYYPNYVNRGGVFLTPQAQTNPALGITFWIVSDEVLGVDGYIRNLAHDDFICPYDMHSGWEYYDPQTGRWESDSTLDVLCVRNN